MATRDRQALIWDFYKPRHTHAWNMLVLSWRDLSQCKSTAEIGFEVEYLWENFFIRLWLYRTTVKTLTKLNAVSKKAEDILASFDAAFELHGKNGLKALRDVVEHFDDYASGKGQGPVSKADLDPWRSISPDRYERGRFFLDRTKSFDAATKLRADALHVSDDFIRWFNSTS